jgi:predicted transposase YdaD
MPLRLLRYQLNIMEEHFNQFPKGNKKIPAVFCFLFYNGKRKPYPYSLDIFDLFYNPELGKQTLAKPAVNTP